jgi:hypothetical protein
MDRLTELSDRILTMHTASGHSMGLTLLLSLASVLAAVVALLGMGYVPGKWGERLVGVTISLITCAWLFYAIWFFM